MQLSTFSFRPHSGWSVPDFPALDSAQTLVMVFAAPEYMENGTPLADLKQAYPRSKLIGCSAAGEIAGACVNDASLSVAVVRFEHSRIAVVSTDITEADSRAAGERLARELDPDGLRGVFVLSEGLNVNGSELVRGLNSVLPPHVVVTGGLAGDGERFQGTWVIRDREKRMGAVVAAGFYGERLRIRHGSRGGWDVFGPERRVTRAKGNVLYELDGRPALALYKEYLGERATDLPAAGLLFPLSIRAHAADTEPLVRCITAVNEADQSMTFAGDVPAGHLAQLMQANFDRLITGASDAADLARGPGDDNGPVLAVAISCVGRRMVLGERTEEETEITLEHLPRGTQQVGFYSYGEISPYTDGACDLHNETMTLTTFCET